MTDFCYSGPMMQRVLKQADTMDQMMQCLGVEPVRAARIDKGMAWYEARSRCIACIHDQRCRNWIAARQGASVLGPPEFCQNAAFFRRAKQPINAKQMDERHEAELPQMGTALATSDAQSPDFERA